jgi:aspartate-semialdehyde dehydrogenase
MVLAQMPFLADRFFLVTPTRPCRRTCGQPVEQPVTEGKTVRIAVVGATGAVGQECLKLIERKFVVADHVVPVASARSAGRDLAGELGLTMDMDSVQDLHTFDPRTVDAAIFSAGAEISRKHAERFAAAGTLVVDNSSAFRMREDVPLVVPQVNPATLAERPGTNLVANPNCSTIQLVRVLQPLSTLTKLEQVILSTYSAGSGGGNSGLAELANTSRQILDGATVDAPGKFGPPLAFDLVPQIGSVDETGFSHEERKLAREPRKILGDPDLRVTATAVRVPVFHCHGESVYVRTTTPIGVADMQRVLAAAPSMRVYPTGYPHPRAVAGNDEDRLCVHVGRIRIDPDDPHGIWLWIVADNLMVGAALNAVEILATVARYGWLA